MIRIPVTAYKKASARTTVEVADGTILPIDGFGTRVVQRLGGGRGCYKFVPVLGGDGTKISPPEDLFDQPPGEMN